MNLGGLPESEVLPLLPQPPAPCHKTSVSLLVMWVSPSGESRMRGLEKTGVFGVWCRQQVFGYHLLIAWETVDEARGLNARFSV